MPKFSIKNCPHNDTSEHPVVGDDILMCYDCDGRSVDGGSTWMTLKKYQEEYCMHETTAEKPAKKQPQKVSYKPAVLDNLRMYVIYFHHPDHADFPYVVQVWTSNGPTDEFYGYGSLSEARLSLGALAHWRYERSQTDTPCIQETWV